MANEVKIDTIRRLNDYYGFEHHLWKETPRILRVQMTSRLLAALEQDN